jgi:hypothetical protein
MTARLAVLLTALALMTLGTVFVAVPVTATTPADRAVDCGSGLNPDEPADPVDAYRLGPSACGLAIADRQTWTAVVTAAGVVVGLCGLAMTPPRRRRQREMAPARPGTSPGARGPKGCPR